MEAKPIRAEGSFEKFMKGLKKGFATEKKGVRAVKAIQRPTKQIEDFQKEVGEYLIETVRQKKKQKPQEKLIQGMTDKEILQVLTKKSQSPTQAPSKDDDDDFGFDDLMAEMEAELEKQDDETDEEEDYDEKEDKSREMSEMVKDKLQDLNEDLVDLELKLAQGEMKLSEFKKEVKEVERKKQLLVHPQVPKSRLPKRPIKQLKGVELMEHLKQLEEREDRLQLKAIMEYAKAMNIPLEPKRKMLMDVANRLKLRVGPRINQDQLQNLVHEAVLKQRGLMRRLKAKPKGLVMPRLELEEQERFREMYSKLRDKVVQMDKQVSGSGQRTLVHCLENLMVTPVDLSSLPYIERLRKGVSKVTTRWLDDSKAGNVELTAEGPRYIPPKTVKDPLFGKYVYKAHRMGPDNKHMILRFDDFKEYLRFLVKQQRQVIKDLREAKKRAKNEKTEILLDRQLDMLKSKADQIDLFLEKGIITPFQQFAEPNWSATEIKQFTEALPLKMEEKQKLVEAMSNMKMPVPPGLVKTKNIFTIFSKKTAPEMFPRHLREIRIPSDEKKGPVIELPYHLRYRQDYYPSQLTYQVTDPYTNKRVTLSAYSRQDLETICKEADISVTKKDKKTGKTVKRTDNDLFRECVQKRMLEMPPELPYQLKYRPGHYPDQLSYRVMHPYTNKLVMVPAYSRQDLETICKEADISVTKKSKKTGKTVKRTDNELFRECVQKRIIEPSRRAGTLVPLRPLVGPIERNVKGIKLGDKIYKVVRKGDEYFAEIGVVMGPTRRFEVQRRSLTMAQKDKIKEYPISMVTRVEPTEEQMEKHRKKEKARKERQKVRKAAKVAEEKPSTTRSTRKPVVQSLEALEKMVQRQKYKRRKN